LEQENLQALFIVLENPELLPEILEIFLECELRGATIIDSRGMAKVLSTRVPIFAGLQGLLKEHEQNKTIFTLSRRPDKIDLVMKKISEKLCGFEEPCSGMMFVVPVVKALGLGKKKGW